MTNRKLRRLLRGGTETRSLQAELNHALVSSLGKLTGIEFPTKTGFTSSEIKQIFGGAQTNNRLNSKDG